MADIEIDIDDTEILRMGLPGGLVYDATKKAAGRVRGRAQRILTMEGQVDTGRLRMSLNVRQEAVGHVVVFSVGSDLEYAGYQHDGTSAHGPVRAKVLRFKPKGGSAFIFRPRVRGVRGTRYIARAAEATTTADWDA